MLKMINRAQFDVEDEIRRADPAPAATAQNPPYRPLQPSRFNVAFTVCVRGYPYNYTRKVIHLMHDSVQQSEIW